MTIAPIQVSAPKTGYYLLSTLHPHRLASVLVWVLQRNNTNRIYAYISRERFIIKNYVIMEADNPTICLYEPSPRKVGGALLFPVHCCCGKAITEAHTRLSQTLEEAAPNFMLDTSPALSSPLFFWRLLPPPPIGLSTLILLLYGEIILSPFHISKHT